MLIIGAGGHASEVLDELFKLQMSSDLFFYDDLTNNEYFQYDYKIFHSIKQVQLFFPNEFTFCLGIGFPSLRKYFADRFSNIGGVLQGVISRSSKIGSFNVNINQGVDIMSDATISSNVSIGKGCLINRSVLIHHDCNIGEFCEIAPGAIILGNVKIGDLTLIGAGAIVLPNIKIGKNCTIAAGAVVTKNVEDNTIVKGVPARII